MIYARHVPKQAGLLGVGKGTINTEQFSPLKHWLWTTTLVTTGKIVKIVKIVNPSPLESWQQKATTMHHRLRPNIIGLNILSAETAGISRR
jgi:hypothetical protein